jgi:hypothetical protein
MRWIVEKEEGEGILRDARVCAAYDDKQQGASKLERFTFDCVEFQTKAFLEFLRTLMGRGGDKRFYYVVLDPEPESYFFANFGKYPMVELSIDDPGDVYVKALNENPGNSPADALGTNWYEYVIFAPSRKWFVRGKRDARSGEGGHLWVATDWAKWVRGIYPFQLY